MKHEIPVFHHSPPIQSSKIASIFSLCIGRSTSLAMPADEDPLTLALAPPANETDEQRLAREAAEAEAKRVSDEIDERLRQEKEREKKKKPLKLLLLGQSESGKTATLKNFQLMYNKREWIEERTSWRAVIYLNLVRNVNRILELMSREMSDRSLYYMDGDTSDDSIEEIIVARARSLPPLRFQEKHRLLQQRLRPLLGVHKELERRLGAAAMELHSTSVTTAAPFEGSTSARRRGFSEFSIHSSNGWKSALGKLRQRSSPPENDRDTLKKANDLDEDFVETLVSCREAITELWEDPIIQEMLSRRKIRFEDAPGFFLNDTERIASWNYQPTDDDVIRARLRTLGVQEYKFVMSHGRGAGHELRMYDVGGTRNSRAAWSPYFDDVDAIIFLAPISPFDERLAEDKRVNRLQDSYLLWRSVCANKLLTNTQFVLFLNKCDLLQAKLQRGIRIRDSVASFGDRKNDFPTATRYFQHHFREIAKQSSATSRRNLYIHLTSVVDTGATAITLAAVEENILRRHLRKADLM